MASMRRRVPKRRDPQARRYGLMVFGVSRLGAIVVALLTRRCPNKANHAIA
jgi:hypothetical protein